jgi:ABC-type transport system involved in cytochrome c biogenesis permease component
MNFQKFNFIYIKSWIKWNIYLLLFFLVLNILLIIIFYNQKILLTFFGIHFFWISFILQNIFLTEKIIDQDWKDGQLFYIIMLPKSKQIKFFTNKYLLYWIISFLINILFIPILFYLYNILINMNSFLLFIIIYLPVSFFVFFFQLFYNTIFFTLENKNFLSYIFLLPFYLPLLLYSIFITYYWFLNNNLYHFHFLFIGIDCFIWVLFNIYYYIIIKKFIYTDN